MKKLFVIAPALVIIVTACNKDKYDIKPQISVSSYTPDVPLNGNLNVTLKYTSKKGNLGDGTFMYWPRLLNVRPIAAGLTDYFPVTDTIPSYPDKIKGEIELTLPRILIYKEVTGKPGDDKNDTLVLKIVVTDRSGNASDTLVTKPIVVHGI